MNRDRTELLQGTLDMLILRTLLLGAAHGHEIAKHIQRTTDDVLKPEHGSLYPALHRLERKGLIRSHRSAGNQRRYDRDVLRWLAVIRMGQELGVPLSEIGAQLSRLPREHAR